MVVVGGANMAFGSGRMLITAGIKSERPHIVFLQDTAGGVGQAGADRHRVARTGLQGRRRRKGIERGVDPFSGALHRRVYL